MLSTVQKAAYELIQSDARFLYSLVNIQKNAKNINSNYIMMSQPYIGIFTEGAEQWCRKVGLDAPRFTEIERAYYIALRQGHKLFEKSYGDYMSSLMYNFNAKGIWRYFAAASIEAHSISTAMQPSCLRSRISGRVSL